MKGPVRGKSISFRYATPDDAAFVFGLRTDSSRNKFVSTVTGEVEDQRRWLESYKLREQRDEEHYFIVEQNGEQVGTVRIYDLRPTSFCWGSWMMKPGVSGTTALESAILLYEFAFFELGFSHSHFDVRIENERVVAFHKRFGAKIVRTTTLDHFFEYSKSDYEKIRPKYAKFLVT